MNSLKKGEGVPLLNFVGGPGIPLLNFEEGPGVPLLNFEGGPGSWVPRSRVPGSWSHFYNMPTFMVMHWKHRENNVKNCINIDLKFLIDLILSMEFSKLFDSLTHTENKEYYSLRKFL